MGKLENSKFAKVCDGKKCACDFRIYISGCREDTHKAIALKFLIPFTLIIVIISISFLYYRVKVKGQSVFFPATKDRGLIRPRPQDSFHIAVGVFNFSQMLVLICLIADLFPNVTSAEIIANVPKLLGFSCAVLYPISIIYSTPVLKQKSYLRLQWNPNKIFIDALAIYLMLGPLLTIIPLTALTGYFADRSDDKAYNMFMAQAFVWSCWTVQYFITLFYVYYKLICMLKGYIDVLQRRRSENPDADMKIRKLKNAAHNLTWIVFAVLLMFFISTLEGIIVGIHYKEKPFRKRHNNSLITCYFISWNFTIPVLTFIGQIIFLYDTLKNRKSSQHQRNNNAYDRVNNIQSHLDFKIASKKITGEIQSTSFQKSKTTMFLSTNNSSTINNSTKKSTMSIDVKTTLVSTSTLVPWESKSDNFERSRNNIKDVDNWKFFDSNIEYYFESFSEDDKKDTDKSVIKSVVASSETIKSWLVKKPIRNIAAKQDATTDRNPFEED